MHLISHCFITWSKWSLNWLSCVWQDEPDLVSGGHHDAAVPRVLVHLHTACMMRLTRNTIAKARYKCLYMYSYCTCVHEDGCLRELWRDHSRADGKTGGYEQDKTHGWKNLWQLVPTTEIRHLFYEVHKKTTEEGFIHTSSALRHAYSVLKISIRPS